jgi:hypothetical protein
MASHHCPRALEANGKPLTTFDTITQETLNMIH